MFEYRIALNLSIDIDTGKPFYLYYDKGQYIKKPYDPSEHIVPEEFREWTQGAGDVFEYIFNHWINDDRRPSLNEVVINYPDWYHVENHKWNEDAHWRFLDALKWFMKYDIYVLEYWYD
jgi:hypothetical protein